MVEQVVEVERKYDVPRDAVVPDLGGLSAGVGPVSQQALVATYLDTDDLRLRSTRTILRHRTGDAAAGWHLKVPAGSARLELRVTGEPPPAPLPEELSALVRSRVRRRPLVPAAVLTTSRTVHPVVDGDGRVLVEVVDDLVEGRHVASGKVLRWREWEAELVAGDEALLDAVGARLLAAGAVEAASSSKVGRVLDASASTWWTAPATTVRRGVTAGDAVKAHVAEQVAELLDRDPLVRRDEPDAVHRMRVATRRLRSALSTFRPLLDPDRTGPLREDLRWLAGVLGQPRDAEVMHARLRAMVDEQPSELVLGPVVQRIDDVLLGRYRAAHAKAVAELDSDRCLALYDALEELVADRLTGELADRPAADVLPVLVRRDDRRLRRALAAARRIAPGHGQDEALHEARKSAKRLRYSCEAVAPVVGRRALRLAKAATGLQEVLGEHQDSVLTREELRALGAASSRAGHNGFTFGRLHGIEQERARTSTTQWHEAAAALSRPKLRRWLA